MSQTLQPPDWAKPLGYANGIAASGRQVFIAGQVGWNAQQQFESDNFVSQTEQTLKNIVTILAEAGGAPEHIVRLTWYVTDKQEYLDNLKEVGRCYRQVMGKHFPAMSLIQIAGLVEDGAKLEIEATAVIPE